MASSNTKRLLLNLILLAVVGVLIAFVVLRKEDTGDLHTTLYDDSIGNDARELIIHAEGHEDVVIQRDDKIWNVIKPSSFVADKEKVRQLFTLLSENAESSYDIKGKDLASYGLDKDNLSVSFNGVKMIFGKFNEVTHQRFILKGDRMYLISETVSGLMMMGEEGFKPQEKPKLIHTIESGAPASK
ncbi:MAG: DUF4340 domain-containing protein [Cocleimonas sp.]|nr:DUF4340 domain-containing protein [Cocleimonas sp.]